jgi:hypothetical protein
MATHRTSVIHPDLEVERGMLPDGRFNAKQQHQDMNNTSTALDDTFNGLEQETEDDYQYFAVQYDEIATV